MNDRLDLDRVVTGWLRASAPPRARAQLLAGTLERVAVVPQDRPFGGRRFDDWIGASPRLHWAIVVALLAVALLGVVAGAGALLRREASPKLDLAPPANGWIAYATSGHGRPLHQPT